ncbi:MarR family transcriptional regulator, partial [Acinetobacter baumannii]|nr:MarR family transcriptional regulator [Acinetobacter baumannii]
IIVVFNILKRLILKLSHESFFYYFLLCLQEYRLHKVIN